MVIGISGKKQSGKDTVGKIIQYLTSGYYKGKTHSYFEYLEDIKKRNDYPSFHTFEIKKFADKVKDIVCLLINCTREQLEDEEFKNTELGEEWWYYKVQSNITYGHDKLPYNDWDKDKYKHLTITKLTPRLLLQLVGTECGRNIIHPNLWVNSIMSEYNSYSARGSDYEFEESNWIITDVRFPNELKAIKDRKGFVIRIEKYLNEHSSDIHPSETALDNAEFTYVLQHQKDLNVLVEQVKEILTKENIL